MNPDENPQLFRRQVIASLQLSISRLEWKLRRYVALPRLVGENFRSVLLLNDSASKVQEKIIEHITLVHDRVTTKSAKSAHGFSGEVIDALFVQYDELTD